MANKKIGAVDEDREIADRVKSLRRGLCWSQDDFAAMIGLTRNAVANIESGRTPLRYDVAWKIAEKFECPIGRLAFDESSDSRFLAGPFPPPDSSAIPNRALLKDVANAVESGRVKKPAFIGPNVIPGADPAGRLHFSWSSLSALIWQCVIKTPLDRQPEMHHVISVAAEGFLRSLPRESEENAAARAKALNIAILRYKNIVHPYFPTRTKSNVDYSTHSADNPGVRLTWKELKSRLKRAVVVHGKKAAAAKFIGVDRSNLNRWLDDGQEPGAEATFRLLEWVTAEEAKTKSPTSATTPAGPKTPTERHQDNEDQQSEPGKPSQARAIKATPRRRKKN